MHAELCVYVKPRQEVVNKMQFTFSSIISEQASNVYRMFHKSFASYSANNLRIFRFQPK